MRQRCRDDFERRPHPGGDPAALGRPGRQGEGEQPGQGQSEHGQQQGAAELAQHERPDVLVEGVGPAQVAGCEPAELGEILHDHGLVKAVLGVDRAEGFRGSLRSGAAEHGLGRVARNKAHREEGDGRHRPQHEDRYAQAGEHASQQAEHRHPQHGPASTGSAARGRSNRPRPGPIGRRYRFSHVS